MNSSISFEEFKKPVINIEELYKSQNERLRRFIQKKVWHQEDAEEILQLTYLEAMRCKDKFSGASKPETWLFGIAVNLTRNYFKQYYGQTVLVDEMTEAMSQELQSDVDENPAMLVEHERLLSRTMEAIENLPSETQSILQLIVDEDLSYQDTADCIGIPIGTIRSRLSRARQTLKSYLEPSA